MRSTKQYRGSRARRSRYKRGAVRSSRRKSRAGARRCGCTARFPEATRLLPCREKTRPARGTCNRPCRRRSRRSQHKTNRRKRSTARRPVRLGDFYRYVDCPFFVPHPFSRMPHSSEADTTIICGLFLHFTVPLYSSVVLTSRSELPAPMAWTPKYAARALP